MSMDLFDFASPAPAGGWRYDLDAAKPDWLAAAIDADRVRFLDSRVSGPFAVLFGDEPRVARPGNVLGPRPDGGVVVLQ